MKMRCVRSCRRARRNDSRIGFRRCCQLLPRLARQHCDIAVIDISVAGDSALSIVALLRRTVNIGIVVLATPMRSETRRNARS
jgi:DNA-binding NarL/FixJ family response regulator